MNSNKYTTLIVILSMVIGMLIGTMFSHRFAGNRLSIINITSNKINDLLSILDEDYVDTVNISDIVEKTMPKILAELDPHSSYISAEDAQFNNDDLKGSFSGIGVQFTIKNDTVYITNIISGGPSEKVGLMAGDRIVSIDGKPYVGKDTVNNKETLRLLKGEKGTKVRLGVVRGSEKKLLHFNITRGDIPITSIYSAYMLDGETVYIKVDKFSESTYAELLTSLAVLEQQHFKGLILDLRGNNGGSMGVAIQMINEFLPANRLIVYTQGRNMPRQDYKSDGHGSYSGIPLVVLTDELSASASEIFAGAIQDNDRGMIVGRRTFGKGLVQQPIEFSDGSIINLTVARYYTPSGRCVQKSYTSGEDQQYINDLLTRFEHGEFFNVDSIRQSGKMFKTRLGREVYGGGGVMPDIFVPEDTTMFTPYYQEAVSKGLVTQFCFDYTDRNRRVLEAQKDIDGVLQYLKTNHVLEDFFAYLDREGVVRRNNMIAKSRRLFETAVYGSIIYNTFDMQEYIEFINRDDITLDRALQLFKDNATTPKK